LKVHGERKFACINCAKAFPTEDALHHHTQLCGIIFKCSCGNIYGSYEALLTHSKRKQHTFDEKFKQYGKRVKLASSILPARNYDRSTFTGQPPPVYILPKPSPDCVGVPVHYLAAVALTELSGSCSKIGIDKVVQTEPIEMRRKKASSPARATERATKRRASAQTQTRLMSRARRPRKSAKTQTVACSTLSNSSQFPDGIVEENFCDTSEEQSSPFKRKKSMETQTVCDFDTGYLGDDRNFEDVSTPTPKLIAGSSSSSSSPLYPMAKDVGLPDLWFAHKNSSSTQTSPESVNQALPSDLNLTFFECDNNVPTNSIRNLNYFEDNSDSLDNVVNSTVTQLESNASNTTGNLDALESLTRGSSYPLLSQPENRSCNIETQTELDSSSAFFSQCSDGSGEGQFTLCSNIETQTTEDIFDALLYSNMCTQTCDEGLFTDLDFVDIETQTAWPNYDESQDSKLVMGESKTPASPSLSISSSNSSSSSINFKSKSSLVRQKQVAQTPVN